MRGRWLALLILLSGVAALGWRGGWLREPLGSATPDPPTLIVGRSRFEHRVTADGYLRAVKATPITVPQAEVHGPLKIAWLIPDGSPVKQGDVVIRFDPTELEKQLQDGESDRATAEAKIARERTQTESAQRGRVLTASLSQLELEKTRAFQRKDPEIFSRYDIIESEIDEGLFTARKSNAEDQRHTEISLSQRKIELLALDRKKADLAIAQASKGLASMMVKAPHEGLVVFETAGRSSQPKVGDNVWPGQRLASLPLLEQMEVEAFVLEADAGGLSKGRPAQVVLESHPGTVYDARITRVDTLAKPRTRGVPVNYFAITLELSRTDRQRMMPGRRVSALLVLDEDRVLTVPRQAVFMRESRQVVYRKQGRRFEPVAVKLGAASPGRLVIEDGLREGDIIALDDPTRPAQPDQAGKETR